MEDPRLTSPIHDRVMPKGWHTIKLVLMKEIQTAENFHACNVAADALFHARLLGEDVARESARVARSQREQ